MRNSLNRFFDRLPRAHIPLGAREVPSFRLLGTAGFSAAAVMVAAAALVTGRSLTITAALTAVCAASFYAYAWLRRWLAGRESLVLLEHVWFALGCCAGMLALLRQPVLPFLDILAPPLAIFLAFGRIGCLVAGCCHGHPAAVGVVYPDDNLWAGVRLFPVQALECAGLLAISLTGFVALPFAPPGGVITWYLVAYAIMRFALERLRGDRRPHWLGLSQAQWMSLAEIVIAVFIAEARDLWVLTAAPLVLAAVLFAWFRSARRRLLLPPHLEELRGRVTELAGAVLGSGAIHPSLHKTHEGAAIAVSWAGASLPGAVHVSLSYRGEDRDLLLLAELAAAAFPQLILQTARITASRVLHFAVLTPLPGSGPSSSDRDKFARQVYAQLFRSRDREAAVREEPSRTAWFFNATGKGG